MDAAVEELPFNRDVTELLLLSGHRNVQNVDDTSLLLKDLLWVVVSVCAVEVGVPTVEVPAVKRIYPAGLGAPSNNRMKEGNLWKKSSQGQQDCRKGNPAQEVRVFGNDRRLLPVQVFTAKAF